MGTTVVAGEATSGRITPAHLAAEFADRAATGTLAADDAKEYFRSLDALALDGAAQADCVAALGAMLDTARDSNLLGRGLLVVGANVRAAFGDVEGAVGLMTDAHRLRPEGFTGNHPQAAVRRLRRYGPDVVNRFLGELRSAGVPVDLERQSAVVVAQLEAAQTTSALTAAIDALVEEGGFPDVVAAGRALAVLRGASGRTVEHALRLFRLARDTSGLAPRILNDALMVLAELGAADECALLLEEARAAGVEPGPLHLVAHMTALNNALRYDEALVAHREYLAAGFPENVRARRVQITALCWDERPAEARTALLAWAEAVRAGSVEAPAPPLLTTVLNSLTQDDIGDLVEAVALTADAFEWNENHRRLVLATTRRARTLADHAGALAAFAAVRRPTTAELEGLLALAADRQGEDVISALTRVCDACPEAVAVLGGTLAAAQIERGELAAAEETARTSRAPEAIEAVTYAHLAAGDIDAALRSAALFESTDAPRPDRARRRGPMPHPPALLGRIVRALASRRGASEAEEWLGRYDVRAWPAEAWEGLASAYRRGKGNVAAIDRMMRRMRGVGTLPTGDVWAHALYALPRAKRAERMTEALDAMERDGVEPTASFYTAAVVGALQPAKVQADGGDAEAAAWENARVALAEGERVLADAVAELADRGRPGRSPERWFTAGQLIEIARAYPLARRPYAQVDAAVEIRLAEETEPAAQFAAFLGAIAAAHARAQLPEGIVRLRALAERVGVADRPELGEALLDSLDDPDEIVAAVLAENERGQLASDAVAEAAGRALARTGEADVVERALDGAEPPLPEEQAERLVSAAVLAFDAAGQLDDARQVGVLAETRGLDLSTAALGVLLATHKPADPVVEDLGPVWTTAQLADYNGLLLHEFANQLQRSRSATQRLAVSVRKLREKLPPDVLDVAGRYLDALEDLQDGLRLAQDGQQRTIEKISAAAQLERASGGTVRVLDAMTSVAQQLAVDAAAATTDIVVPPPEEIGQLAVRGHATLLSFALHNLISNGIKAHTRRGGEGRRQIELMATFDESDRDDLAVAPYGWVLVAVRDHGDGVPHDLPENVANWSMAGQPGQGAGIGLRQTEHMIRGSGGQLWVDPSVTDGSRFCFRLPSAARRSARGSSLPTSREDSDRA